MHNKQRGYLCLKQCKDLIWELNKLIDTPPEEVPEPWRVNVLAPTPEAVKLFEKV